MNSPKLSSGRREVLILNLDTFATKNVSQIRLMETEGYGFTVLTNDSRGKSQEVFDAAGFKKSRLRVLAGLRDKIATTSRILARCRFHHVELYPAGRLALWYLLLLKLFHHRVVVVERGDLGSLHLYDALTRFTTKLAYRFADCVIYKETYMKEPLESLTRAPLAFVPNSVDRRPAETATRRTIDFLWANRIIPQRRPEWVVEAMADPRLADRMLMVLGTEAGTTLDRHLPQRQRQLQLNAGPNVTLKGFIDPEPSFRQARFFCLPAEIVFANNALLEAMAWGVVPIVTDAPGVELLLQDRINGIVTRLEEDAYHEAMVSAAAMPDSEWQQMSRNAVQTVRERFSVSSWTGKMAQVYSGLGCLHH